MAIGRVLWLFRAERGLGDHLVLVHPFTLGGYIRSLEASQNAWVMCCFSASTAPVLPSACYTGSGSSRIQQPAQYLAHSVSKD